MINDDIAVVLMMDSIYDSKPTKMRNSIKRKIDDKREFTWLDDDEVLKQYSQVTNKSGLSIFSYEELLNRLYYEFLFEKIDYEIFDNFESFYDFVSKFNKLQKRAIDYVSLWDAKTPEVALNWLVSHPEEECRRNFVELVLKEQPEKNFWEALERVCEAWNIIRCNYSYNELYDNDVKSDEVKLLYCKWLETETKTRNVELHTFHKLVELLQVKLLPEKINTDINNFFLDCNRKHAIDYVCFLDAERPEEALNWLISCDIQDFRVQFVYSVCIEQPKKNFWEALKRVCKARNKIRKKYSYKEVFNNDEDSKKVKLKYCRWLRVEKKPVLWNKKKGKTM